MRHARLLTIALVGIMGGMLAGCVSGKPHSDTYTDHAGTTSIIQSDREQCERSCNLQNARCGETTAARNNGGVIGPACVYGASAECNSDLSSCIMGCKSR